ncbi:hypothetical protein ACFL6C_03620 [Myxococcota bacterium]
MAESVLKCVAVAWLLAGLGTCTGRSDLGMPTALLGEDCLENVECSEVCIGGACARYASGGQECDEPEDCVVGFSCADGFCRGTEGSACSTDADCIEVCIEGSCSPISGGPCPAEEYLLDASTDLIIAGDTTRGANEFANVCHPNGAATSDYAIVLTSRESGRYRLEATLFNADVSFGKYLGRCDSGAADGCIYPFAPGVRFETYVAQGVSITQLPT